MNFWENVDSELKYLGKTRKALACEANFDVTYISKGIARGGMPLADLALRISHALKVPLETLLEIDEAPIKKSQSHLEAKQAKNNFILKKYFSHLQNLEKMPKGTREKFIALAKDFAAK